MPISIHKPFPKKNEEKLKRAKEQKMSDEQMAKIEAKEEKEIAKDGEIMELAKPDDESEEDENPEAPKEQ